MKRKIFSVLLALVLVLSFSLVTALPAGAQAADGDVTIIVQNQTGTAIEGATARLLFYGGGKGGNSMDGKSTDATGSATFTAAEIATWLTAEGYTPTGQIYAQPGAKVETDTAYGNVRTVDPDDGFPCIPYNTPDASLVPLPAMTFIYNTILMSTEPVQTVWDDPSNEFTVTATLADSLSVIPDETQMRLIRNLVGGQLPAAGGSDDDWWMWNGTAYEQWKGIATVEATATGASVSAIFSQDIFSDWLVGNKTVVRPEFGVNRTVDGVPCIDDYSAVDILRPSSYIHPAQIDDSTLFYPTIQDAIDAASATDTISVAAGTYTENIVVGEQLILEGAKVGVDPTVEGARAVPAEESTIQGSGGTAVTLSADGVVITGFTITNPDGLTGVLAVDRSDLTIEDNIVTAIGNGDDDVKARGIVVTSLTLAVDNITIARNKISNITSGLRTGGSSTSAQGINVGQTNGDEDVTNLLIQDNVISDIDADTSPWLTTKGQGAYGILLSHSTAPDIGETVDAQILDNTISDLEGLWAHGIGLEGNTPGAVVRGNSISNLTDHKSPSDAVAIQVEDNLGATTLTIEFNSVSGVKVGIQNTTSLPVTAENNWWGHSSGTATVGDVDIDPWLLTVEGLTDENLRYDKTLSLPVGWSIISPDAELESWESVGEGLMYAYNDGGFTTDFTLDAITPMFIKTATGGGIGFNYAVGSMGLFTTDLETGWNLIGVPQTGASTRAILSPLRYGQNDETALATLVSQGQYNPSGVSFYMATTYSLDWVDMPNLNEFDGYWAYMNVAKEFGVVVVQ